MRWDRTGLVLNSVDEHQRAAADDTQPAGLSDFLVQLHGRIAKSCYPGAYFYLIIDKHLIAIIDIDMPDHKAWKFSSVPNAFPEEIGPAFLHPNRGGHVIDMSH